MDVELMTHCDDPTLCLAGIERYAGDSGFSATLDVVSNGFAARKRFYFGRPELEACIRDLQLMSANLLGKASLYHEHELDELEFSMTVGGHVTVQGSLLDFGQFEQSLKFGFVTDQTVIESLIRDLSACLTMPVLSSPEPAGPLV